MPSVNKRIRYESFPADYRDGQVLRAQDVNKIINYIYEGVNANKKDLDQILTGRYKSFVYYNVNITAPPADVGENGDYAFIYFNDETGSADKLVLFRKNNNNTWVELYEVSLLKAFQRLDYIDEQKIDKTETRQVGDTIIAYESGVIVSISSDNVVESIEYDVNGGVDKVTSTYADGKVYEETYTKDVNGNITKIMKVEVI